MSFLLQFKGRGDILRSLLSAIARLPRKVRLMQRLITLGGLIVLFCCATSVSATLLYTDGFESYTAGGNPLDKNLAGPNSALNGSGNPWFGPAPPNARVSSATTARMARRFLPTAATT